MSAIESSRPSIPPEPPKRPWWQHGWGATVIGVVGLLVGVGAGIGVSGSSTTRTVTAEGSTTTVEAASPPARTVTHVVVHTHTVTQTQAAAPTESSSGGPGEVQSFSGNGGKNLGTITVEKESTLEWTNDGLLFQVYTSEGVPVNSQAHRGSSVLEAGTYKNFQVNAVGSWTIRIAPK
jgi:hypothetical protein